MVRVFTLVALGLVSAAQAAFISGSIAFGGAYDTQPTSNNLLTATGLKFKDVSVATNTQFGDYAAIPNGTAATYSDLTFSPFVAGQLWTISVGPTTYSFWLDSCNVLLHNSQVLALTGTGTASMTGYEDTPGRWSITANKNGRSMSFSSGADVPDAGTSIALFGAALLGLGFVRRILSRR